MSAGDGSFLKMLTSASTKPTIETAQNSHGIDGREQPAHRGEHDEHAEGAGRLRDGVLDGHDLAVGERRRLVVHLLELLRRHVLCGRDGSLL